MSATKIVLTETRRLFREWRAFTALMLIYALLLATLFLFVATKEATLWQITCTLLFAALSPALFFILQAMIANYAQGRSSARSLLKSSLRDSCRLALASMAFALLASPVFYLTNKLQALLPALVFSSLRLLLFAVVLPLIIVNLWSATLREGLRSALKKMHRSVARAFAPVSLRIYFAGLLLFGLIPYLLLFMHTSVERTAVAFGIFITRLVLVLIFTLTGWVLTVSSLARASDDARDVESVAEGAVFSEN
jgi:uncharacterized membrane protein (DUF485 family)